MSFVKVNNFVKRQTSASKHSHCIMPFEDIAEWVEGNWDNKEKKSEGVYSVPIQEDYIRNFYSGIAQLNEGSVLIGSFKPREGVNEHPRKSGIQTLTLEKVRAVSCRIIVYSSEKLAEGVDNCFPTGEGNWEIISINASPTEGETPQTPETLMANWFGLSGGSTYKDWTVEKFVEELGISVEFWKDKAMWATEKQVEEVYEALDSREWEEGM